MTEEMITMIGNTCYTTVFVVLGAVVFAAGLLLGRKL